jgi:molecular chaperone Hsp33
MSELEPDKKMEESSVIEVRTYFVRGRNALLARADFADLYLDYYLHQGITNTRHAPNQDELFKELLAGMTLHAASRPRQETAAWTVHFQEPRLNLFVNSDNLMGTVVGQIFTQDVKDTGKNVFLSDLVKLGQPSRRSSVDFQSANSWGAVEEFYARSEQRVARLFQYMDEDFVMISAQPDCDEEWLTQLTVDEVRKLDQNETLSLLEKRTYRWHCGCTEERMMQVLAPVMKQDPQGLFADETSLRMRCPRCGLIYVIGRTKLEAFVENQ